MTHTSPVARATCTLTTGLLALAGCSAPPAPTPAAQPATGAARASLADDAPLDARGQFDSVWGYLAEKYDADGDGRLTQAEYGRGPQAFTRLDSNADGVIDAADFDPDADGVSYLMSQLMLGVYLQADGDPEHLDAAELEQAFGAYDENFDARLTRAEFEALRVERAQYGRPLEDSLASQFDDEMLYTVLTGGIDSNADQTIDFDEVLAFHGRFLAHGALPRTYTGGLQASATLPVATLGAPAPDFTLEPYQGDQAVTLSSFRDRRPVALIFGSYT